MDSASEPSERASGTGAGVLAALVGAALLGAMFAGDGSGVGGTLPVGGAALLLLVGALLAVAFGRLPAPRLGRSGAVLVWSLVLLVTWTGVTVWWSIVGDRSWDAFNKSVAYAVFLGLGLVLAAAGRAQAARLAGAMLSIVIGTTLVWALVTKAVPALAKDERVARLNEPVDHWNALALLADIAIVLGLWLGTERAHRRAVRVAGALLVYVATLALMLTLSRAGVVVGVVVLALWLFLSTERVQSGLLLVASAGPALAIAGWAFTRSGLSEDLASLSDREADGAVFGVLALVGAAVVVALVMVGLRRSLTDEARRRLGRALAIAAVILVLAAGAAASVAAADAVSSGRDCSAGRERPEPTRLARRRQSPVLVGRGVGRVRAARARGRRRGDVRDRAETLPAERGHGPPAAQRPASAARRRRRGRVRVVRRADPGRSSRVRLRAPPAGEARSAQPRSRSSPPPPRTSVMRSWITTGTSWRSRRRRWSRSACSPSRVASRSRPEVDRSWESESSLLAAVVLVSFSFPRLADRAERRSTRALVAGDLDKALDEARWAHRFNPVSADPLFAQARVAERQRVPLRAERAYIRAVELQPDNPLTWYTLGIFEFDVRENLCAAYRFLNNSYTLDPAGNQWQEGGPLDVARDAVNDGGCAPGS